MMNTSQQISSNPVPAGTIDSSRFQSLFSLEQAAKYVEKCLNKDNTAPTLFELMNITPQTGPTCSGLAEHDYPSIMPYQGPSTHMIEMLSLAKVPLPQEIMENFNHMQCNCMMGLFPEINRAWLTIDSDIYVWTYDQGSDVAFYDGLNETIISVGLIKPKPGVFHTFIKYLLILTTSIDIVVLGVTFTPNANGTCDEIQLVPDPVFTIPTDGTIITAIAGTHLGRLFLGGKDGCLYEISYQAESSWFGKRSKKINHSTSSLSFLVPSFLNAALSEDDGIMQITVDDSRNILYVLTEKGSIEVYDMGEKGTSFTRVTKVSQNTIVQQAMQTVRTLESQNFKPIISISPVEFSESPHINLVAISQTGVRFYLSTTSISNTQTSHRPYTLTLVHVRLPPGYSATMSVQPRMVHHADYRDKSLVMVTSVNEKEVMWCLSSDMFPFSNMLMECYNTVNLDGPVQAMAEIRNNPHEHLNKPQQLTPPATVRQHAEPPRKYIVLTSHGAHIFLKLSRPLDVLRDMLINNPGMLDTEPIKAFFNVQPEEQGCATSLILACSEDNQDIAEGATRAFFMFGGEPKLMPVMPPPQHMQMGNQVTQMGNTTIFSPNIISTPMSNQHQQTFQYQQPQSPQSAYQSGLFNSQQSMLNTSAQMSTFIENPFSYSAKHNGLYLYLGRILRPIWNVCCVEQVIVDGKKMFLSSTLTSEDCVWILCHLEALRTFLNKNTQLCLTSSAIPSQNQTIQNMSRQNYTLQEAQLEERHSLDALKSFVNHACQVLGLWRILCDHQFHILVDTLPDAQKQSLQNTIFRDLFLYGQDIYMLLINNLINSYLGDNASVDSISAKLRDICPNLYRNEDAAVSKANEILQKARATQNLDTKEELIIQSLNISKNVLPNINLHFICQQFTELKSYHSVIDLCVAASKKVDPENIGDIYYKSNEPSRDGFNFYNKRMECYKEVINMLDAIYIPPSSNTTIQQLSFNTSMTGRDTVQNIKPNNNLILHQVINDILNFPDELLHAAVYEWMMSKKLTGDIIKIKAHSLENYLLHVMKQTPENILILDVLWKYYENNNNHAAAAKILNNLASIPGPSATLKDRLGYLARSIMCMRSDKVGYAPYLGVFLRELEDKLDVAKVQEMILEAISSMRGVNPNVEDAINALNQNLYDITNLYEDFAEPLKLWECKLAIIECASNTDNKLAETIWANIIQAEVARSTGSGNDKMIQILSKVKQLAKRYPYPSPCLPLERIIEDLEIVSASLKVDPTLVPNLFVSLEIPVELLIKIYVTFSHSFQGSKYFTVEQSQQHFYKCLAAVIHGFILTHDKYSSVEKRKIVALCEDTTAGILSDLYSRSDSNELIDTLRNLQARLSHI